MKNMVFKNNIGYLNYSLLKKMLTPERFRQWRQCAVSPINHPEEVQLVALAIHHKCDLFVGLAFLPTLLLGALHQICHLFNRILQGHWHVTEGFVVKSHLTMSDWHSDFLPDASMIQTFKCGVVVRLLNWLVLTSPGVNWSSPQGQDEF